MPEETETKEEAKVAKIPSFVQVGEFARAIDQPVGRVIGELMKKGVLATINEIIDFETAAIVAEYLGVKVEQEQEKAPKAKQVKSNQVEERPPVVTVMGHVDHGKTSLLDAVRETDVVAGEKGGITQHIGAYQIEVRPSAEPKSRASEASRGIPLRQKAARDDFAPRKITFLDTPGHEAFSAMRAQGANVTDVVVLVVAADDGVKPQTVEAANLAKEAGVPIVVAINKIDSPAADTNRVMGDLAGIGLNPEEWGGDTVTVPVSAKTKEGLDKLLDMIVLVSDIKELKAELDVPATGVVIESHVDYGKGPVATVLIQNGTLREGDFIQAGETYGRVRAMEDYRGKKIKEATPAMPAKISGLKEVSQIAEYVQVFASEQEARREADLARKRRMAKKMGGAKKVGIEQLTAAVKAGKVKELNVILKADVAGSLDAILESLGKFKSEEVTVKVVSSAVGEISDSDVQMAVTTGAVILGFSVGMASSARVAAGKNNVTVSIYGVIYELLDDVKKALESLLPPERVETDTGKLKILKVFMTEKSGMIFGGKLTEGKISKGHHFEISKAGDVAASGEIISVKHEQEEVAEAVAGKEYGLKVTVDNPKAVAEGDTVRIFKVEERKRTL